MKSKTSSSIELSDATIAAVLRTVRNHTFQTEADLSQGTSKTFDNSGEFDEALAHLLAISLIEKGAEFITLSEKGQRWLDDFGTELAVEDEGPDGNEPLQKPYAVSKLKMESKQISVFQALRKIERKEIHLNPEFQRAFVWDEVKQSRLIESILIRIPLPAFYIDATDQVRWSVVDGLQRLTTLYRYCREESFKLKGLQFLTALEGLKFSEIPPEYRVLIEDDTQLLFYNLMPGTPIEAKFTIFSRVNTGGMQLTPQEIRHALNQGKVTALLSSLAKDPAFLRATGGVVESLRMSDRELILRALAFMHIGVDAYKEFNELDSFLLHAMGVFNKETDEILNKLKNDFVQSLDKIQKLFGRYAFRKFTERNGRRSPFNKALFETWIIAVRQYPQEKLLQRRNEILDGFVHLINFSPSFVRSISSSTGSFYAVTARFSTINTMLAETCHD